MSAALLLGGVDEPRHPIELPLAHLLTLDRQQRGDRLFGRVVEEGLEQVGERGLARGIAPRDREIDVGASLFLVANMPFLLEDAEERAHRGVARRVGEAVHHFGRSRAPNAKEQVHDLSLSSAQVAGLVAHVVLRVGRGGSCARKLACARILAIGAFLGPGWLPRGPVRGDLPPMTIPDPCRALHVDYPSWVADVVRWNSPYRTDEDRMRLAIALSRANVEHDTGGPFGAAIFERESGRLVAVGINSVVRPSNCTLHGEMVAFMMAQRRLGSFTLNAPHLPAHELVTSCEPCAMCLGATLWSGVRRLMFAATRDDATAAGFDEGPVFPESYAYLERAGVEVVRGLCRDEGKGPFERYKELGGPVYNP